MRKFSISMLIALLVVCFCFSACTQTPDLGSDGAPTFSAGAAQTLGEAKEFELVYDLGSDLYGAQIRFDLPANIKVKSFKIFSGDTELQCGTANRYLYLKQVNTDMILFFAKRSDTSLDATAKVNQVTMKVTFTASKDVLEGSYTIGTIDISKVTSIGSGSTVDVVTTQLDNVSNVVALAR